MPEPTRAEDYERLTWIADQLDELGAQGVAMRPSLVTNPYYDERRLIWNRRVRRGDSQAELARQSRVGRAQIAQGIEPQRLAVARRRRRMAGIVAE
jgi:hypothetical protein